MYPELSDGRDRPQAKQGVIGRAWSMAVPT